MSEQERLTAAELGLRPGVTQYLVLERRGHGLEYAWVELGVVTLPKRSRRSAAVLVALRQADREPVKDAKFRVIDADGELTLQPKQLPPVEERFEVVSVDG